MGGGSLFSEQGVYFPQLHLRPEGECPDGFEPKPLGRFQGKNLPEENTRMSAKNAETPRKNERSRRLILWSFCNFCDSGPHQQVYSFARLMNFEAQQKWRFGTHINSRSQTNTYLNIAIWFSEAKPLNFLLQTSPRSKGILPAPCREEWNMGLWQMPSESGPNASESLSWEKIPWHPRNVCILCVYIYTHMYFNARRKCWEWIHSIGVH